MIKFSFLRAMMVASGLILSFVAITPANAEVRLNITKGNVQPLPIAAVAASQEATQSTDVPADATPAPREHAIEPTPAVASAPSPDSDIAQPQTSPVDTTAPVEAPAPLEPADAVPFALEPAVMAPSETAVVGLPDGADASAADESVEPSASPGLFDTAHVGPVSAVDPVEAAANALAEQNEAVEHAHGDNERSA